MKSARVLVEIVFVRTGQTASGLIRSVNNGFGKSGLREWVYQCLFCRSQRGGSLHWTR